MDRIYYFLAVLMCVLSASCGNDIYVIPGDEGIISTDLYLGKYGINMKIENITQGSMIFCEETILFDNDSILDISYGDTIVISIPNQAIFLPECENIVDLIFLDKEMNLNKFPYEYTYVISNMSQGIYPCSATYSRKAINPNSYYTSIGRETTLYLHYK